MKPEKSATPVKHKPESLTLVALALFLLLLKTLMMRMTMTKFQNSKGLWSMSMRKETTYEPPPFPQLLSTFMLPLQSLSGWLRPSRKTRRPGIMKNTSQSIFMDSTTCSPRTPSMNYQSPNPRITPLNLFRKPMPLRVVRSTPCPSLSKRNSMPSSRKISTLVVSAHPNPQWPHQSSLSKRSAAVFGWFRITAH